MLQKEYPKVSLLNLTLEISELIMHPTDGILLIPNDQNIFDIQAWIQGPEGILSLNKYQGTPFSEGAFRLKLTLGQGIWLII